MKSDAPAIELTRDPVYPPQFDGREGLTSSPRNPKIRVFALAFLVPCILGLAFTFLRPAIYASNAVLLVEPPADRSRLTGESPAGGPPTAVVLPAAAANVQYLATERQRLLSEPVLQAVTDEIAPLVPESSSPLAARAAIEAMIDVSYAADTNLVQMRAEDAQKDLLPALMQAWLAAYLRSREETNLSRGNSEHQALSAQLDELTRRIEQQRSEVDGFRREHDIVSQERTENRDLAKLRGLNDGINTAEQEEIKAVAQLDAIRAAIAAGEPVTQGRDRAAIERMEEKITLMREQVLAHEEQFTEKFSQFAPEILAARKNLERAEQDLATKKRDATNEVLTEAERAVASARVNKASLVEQQTALKARIADFSARFQELDSKQQELGQLEAQAASLRDRLLRTEVAQDGLFPNVTVLQAPTLPSAPVRPHYARDAGISVAAALTLAVLVVLLYDYLTRTPAPGAPLAAPPIPNILSYSTQVFPPHAGAQALPHQGPLPALPPQRSQRELSPPEVKALFDAADDAGQVAIGMLLAGVTLDEAARLEWPQIDVDRGELLVGTPVGRTISLPAAVQPALSRMAIRSALPEGPLWDGRGGVPLTAEDLRAMVGYLAQDAGLANPQDVSPEALRHTYLAFLARQGCRLRDLPRVAGEVPPTTLASYAALCPPGPGRALEEIDIGYPGLALR